ncbi:symporter [Alkalihalobacillus alcalophilus ATCC 27647 = CGMCC 1.3604]|uniref:Symporter n=1 Tax=Alkalihalobacillus alcalophilus ATCC 27647 = CGMCC 1.3604 TaxID=1218173 RepID=J8TPL1_ALKAL|nr:sodium/solute symporter [Alkalihalobacillus alcalophilus]AFV25885.1 sodium ion:proline symporter transporter [Alkalihalobacillus alcalophilus ATCC 27647 = CGMCC 1.3604]KGA96488.1 symporter [Alkalihalobacillus alcalophilus ATCC 27647 = CGMCC 1.3604]MED1562305.1 sodium/solute symporter [Alkalihalobacillus alcalophilus]THG88376.1 symporter [Alkalihalobacillus alcalophilus ATCC 27647 = CGMCC 1.3604]
MSYIGLSLFVAIVAATLVITYWAAKRTNTASEFYTAGGGLTGWQNGLAIAGDYLSAASFLGIAGAIALFGFDGFFFSIGYLVAYLVVLYIVAEPLRNLGKYTIADMITARFNQKKVRGVAALSTITIVIFYMIAQLVGAGALIQLLLGIDYWIAVLLVGTMMTIYVLFGGMTATSWVQIIKAVLLMVGTVIISVLVLWKFNFNILAMFEEMKGVTPAGEGFLNAGVRYTNGIDTISMMAALVLGTAGLPHILMRFFTVKDAKTARSSVVTATWIVGIFYILTIFLGFGAAAFVGSEKIIAANPAGNMAAPLLAEALGGDILMSFVAAVAFATILAVVAGLVLSGASAFAHDVYGQILKKGKATERQQMMAARYASVAVSALSIIIALFAQTMNVAFLVSLAFCVAASANLPVIIYTIYWKRFNTAGAVTGMLSGLITALVLVALSPNVINPVAGAGMFVGDPIFPLTNPAIISIPAGFLGAYVGALLSNKRDEKKYAEVLVKANTGIK